MTQVRPNFTAILEARRLLRDFLPRTPVYSYPQLNQRLDARIFIKHENYLPTGVFKVRGALNLIHNLPRSLKEKGVVTASTGNHAQAVAYAASLFKVPATVIMPEKSNPTKVTAVKSFGAKIVFFGRIFDESRDYAEKLAGERGARFIHPANEPELIAGVGTYCLELLEEVPDLDVIIVPVGGGSGASGCCLVKERLRPEIEVIAVQSEQAPAAFLSWQKKKIVTAEMKTVAEGLATQVGYELTQDILQDCLADFVLVSDEEMAAAIRIYMELVRNMVEEAGAAPLAAAFRIKNRLRGKKVGLILSGGNISMGRLREILV